MKEQAETDRRWRVFCAVELPEAVRERVIQHVSSLKKATPDAQASWGGADNIHLTVKFLGEIQQTSIHNLSAAASHTVTGLTPFTLSLSKTGVFPDHGSASILWIRVKDLEGNLGKLQARLETEAERFGFRKETRAFHPHITVARLPKPQHAKTLAAAHKSLEFEPVEFTVTELLVIRSELSSAGSKYSIISRHALVKRE